MRVAYARVPVFRAVAAALTNRLYLAAVDGNVVVVDQLLRERRADPRIDHHRHPDEREWALVGASRFNHLTVVERLLDDCDCDCDCDCDLGDVNRVDPTFDRNRAVCLAATHGHADVVTRLLRVSGVDPSANDDYALCKSSVRGHTAVVVLLLTDARTDAAAQDNYALRWAAYKGHADVVAALLADARTDPSANSQEAIYDAARRGHADVVRLLMTDARTDASAVDNRALRAAMKLKLAVMRDSVLRLLLRDARVDPGVDPNWNWNWVGWAIRTRSTTTLDQLLRDPRVPDGNGPSFCCDWLMFALLQTRVHADVVTRVVRDSRTTLGAASIRLLGAAVDGGRVTLTLDLLSVLSATPWRREEPEEPEPVAPTTRVVWDAIVRRRTVLAHVFRGVVRSRAVCRDVVYAHVRTYTTGRDDDDDGCDDDDDDAS